MYSAWLAYPRPLAILGDQLFVRMLKARGLAFVLTGALTVRYTIHYVAAYLAQKRPVPPDARPPLDLAPALDYCRDLPPEQRRKLEATIGFPLEAILHDLAPQPPV